MSQPVLINKVRLDSSSTASDVYIKILFKYTVIGFDSNKITFWQKLMSTKLKSSLRYLYTNR